MARLRREIKLAELLPMFICENCWEMIENTGTNEEPSSEETVALCTSCYNDLFDGEEL